MKTYKKEFNFIQKVDQLSSVYLCLYPQVFNYQQVK